MENPPINYGGQPRNNRVSGSDGVASLCRVMGAVIKWIRKWRRKRSGLVVPILGMMLVVYSMISILVASHHLNQGGVGASASDSPSSWHTSFYDFSGSSRSSSSPAFSSDYEDVSACLLVMDDNHYLMEWLAYHYHAANLRTLVIVMDPQSQTSPKSILDRWKDLIDITFWTDSDFATREEYQEALAEVQAYFGHSRITPSLARHRTRQRLFYFKCLQNLQQRRKHWTLLIDTDEFLTINYKTAREYNLTRGISPPDQPGAVAHFLHETTSHIAPVDKLQDNMPLHLLQSSPCVQIPRIRFGALEAPSSPQDSDPLVPPEYNATDFLTLRWRYHAAPHDYKKNKISKTILDLSRISPNDLLPVDSIHLPVRSMCEQRKLHLRKPQSLLVLHHYLGSYEQYTYREKDARLGKERSQKKWLEHNRISPGGGSGGDDPNNNPPPMDDDEIRPWLQGFHRLHPNAAPQLLEGVGQLDPKSWTTYGGSPLQDRCAMCFFGLPRAYKAMVLPSIVQNLLIPNVRHNCDIYVHFYEQFQEAAGRKNRGGTVDPHEVYLLEDAVRRVQAEYGSKHQNDSLARTHRNPEVLFTFDTEAQFWKTRGETVARFQNTTNPDDGNKPLYFPYLARTYERSSIDNLVKQWHSIEYAFKLMDFNAKQLGVNYTRVGMFRSDTMYLTPIDLALLDNGVTDTNNEYSVVAGFAQMPINDRMVYGPYEAIKIWSTRRFELVEARARARQDPGYVMHSERFLNVSVFPAMEAIGYPTNVNRDLCFVRTRADESAMISDCSMGGITRGWGKVNKQALVERIVGRNCTRFKMGKKWTFVGCNPEIEYYNGK